MKIEWTVTSQSPMTLKSFLKTKRISKRLLAKVKFQGGRLEVNQELSRVRKQVSEGDLVSLSLPDEPANDHLEISDKKIVVLFEDEHFLLVDKPSNVPSVPSSLYRNHTMANRVKGYIEKKDYRHKTIHIVTRLDKDTSGVMIFAKHGLAHSYLDQLLKGKELYKEYVAFVNGKLEKRWDLIDRPIGRMEDSIIKRQVVETGKPSKTEYWVKKRYRDSTLVKIQLHTGRTHQIRVHFSDIGHALLGDTLYNPGSAEKWIDRQALHCAKVVFDHPFTGKELSVESPLPDDLKRLSNQLESVSSEKKS
ncbi:23S rRNA pseudouridine1911/1915/1917 synthase [Alkalibacterium putridalgicola]|uniref:Pseudouridine synthase n=1 Tax=Alkalibacterium putridalgicola TaxID=426703 RepID=A0A1H7SWK2_9LACT|nr:RluA family pseudouridine synthase [Alkalibacterium putridalgicola]GEK89218.1 pseudouridine synthase [Alkalibacterium putridalgicola]SEL76818.1 23S rRNA pseudouridine1911/1915/1917 synthase [Alkalibacterium putridalgicola]